MIKIQPRNFNICNRNLAVLFAVFLVAASMLLNDVAYAGYWVKDDAGGVRLVSDGSKEVIRIGPVDGAGEVYFSTEKLKLSGDAGNFQWVGFTKEAESGDFDDSGVHKLLVLRRNQEDWEDDYREDYQACALRNPNYWPGTCWASCTNNEYCDGVNSETEISVYASFPLDELPYFISILRHYKYLMFKFEDRWAYEEIGDLPDLLEKHGVSKPALNAATSDDLQNCLEPNTYPNGNACDKIIETGYVDGRQVTDDEMGQAYIQRTNTLGLTGAIHDADLLTQRVELVSKGIDYLEKGEDISLIRWGYFNRSGLYEELEQHKKAIADINTYIALDGPYISNALSSRAKAYLALGKRKLAISDYKKAIELAGDPVAETIARLALQELED